MNYELPEVPKELFNISIDSLKKLFSLLEKLTLDLHGQNKTRQLAAMFMINLMMKTCSDNYQEKTNE